MRIEKLLGLVVCIAVFLTCVSQIALAGISFEELEPGDSRASSASAFDNQETARKLLKNGMYGMDSFFTTDSGNKFFILIDTYLINYDLGNKKVLSKRPLTRWSYINRPEPIVRYHETMGWDSWKSEPRYTSHLSYAGCLNDTPLRFGDIENDGAKELVLFLNGELIIFSPKRGRTVFSTFVDASDWLSDSQEQQFDGKSIDGASFQYHSEMFAVNGYKNRAYRSYTKVYMGDFDEDGNPGIVTWRKTYTSNEVGEQAGFHQVDEKWRYFERDLESQAESESGVTGEYLPREKSAEDIITWLSNRGLRWPDGFPSKSECEGEKGQLIPEMHDPLVNDPEVLP